MSDWMQHHVVAICEAIGCRWSAEAHTSDWRDGRSVLLKARVHGRLTGHYVQVERGQHLHINPPERAAQ